METKKQYTAPELTVVTFKAERGYAASDPAKILRIFALSNTINVTSTQETWALDDNAFGSSWEI